MNDLEKFVAKPVVIEAYQVNKPQLTQRNGSNFLVREGDWIIIGIDGLKYSCSDQIFRQLYDPIEPQQTHIQK